MDLRVATANTKLGKAVRNRLGLEAIFDCDVWLLQEVHNERDRLDKLLEQQTDLKIAYAADSMGLAIAVRKSFEVKHHTEHIIREKGRLAMLATGVFKSTDSLAFRQRARGIISVGVMVDGVAVTLATGHPPIPHDRSHTSHIQAIAPILNDLEDPLVFGGDMNHWPGPLACDLEMVSNAGLNAVDIGSQTTWHARKSRQKLVAPVLERFGFSIDGQLDALYTRGFSKATGEVIGIDSDHDAIAADLSQLAA